MSYESVGFDQSDHRLRRRGVSVLQFPRPWPNHGNHSAQLVVAVLCPENRYPGPGFAVADGALSAGASGDCQMTPRDLVLIARA